MKRNPYIAVDLDGTLARHDGILNVETDIGPPVPKMLERVKGWLAEGREVRILTARAAHPEPARTKIIALIEAWCEEHVGQKLPVVCTKDYNMVVLYDDRAVQVEMNTGRIIVPDEKLVKRNQRLEDLLYSAAGIMAMCEEGTLLPWKEWRQAVARWKTAAKDLL